MIDHRRFLELAAASIDFPLAPDEAAALERHLATCDTCRATAQAMRMDAATIAALPIRAMPAARQSIALGGALRMRQAFQPMRMLFVAALLALVAAGIAVAGAEFLRRLQQQVVVDSSHPPTQSQTPAPSEAAVFHSSEYAFLVPFSVRLVDGWGVIGLPADYNQPQRISFSHTGPYVQVEFQSLAQTHISDGSADGWAEAEPWPADLATWLADHPDLIVVASTARTIAGHAATVTDVTCTGPFATGCPITVETPSIAIGMAASWKLRLIEIRTSADRGLVIGFSSIPDDFEVDAQRLDALIDTLAFESDESPSASPTGLTLGAWAAAGNLQVARSDHAACLLADGRVLATGGHDSSLATTATAELFDPGSGAWQAAAGMDTPRELHGLAALPDGTVIAVGGIGPDGRALASTERYDPATNAWSQGPPMAHARASFGLALLPNGNLVAIGGFDSTGAALASAEMYDWQARTWSHIQAMTDARAKFSATVLDSGAVLVAGGLGGGGTSIASVEILDPASLRWTAARPMHQARRLQTATVLQDGTVLVAGGFGTRGSAPLGDAEIFDPATGRWSVVPGLASGRDVHGAALLPNGQVIVIGGSAAGSRFATTELFDPVARQWVAGPPLGVARAYFATVVLGDGRVLAIGGDDDRCDPTATTEILSPPS